MDTNSRLNKPNFKTGLDLLDGIVSLEPGAQPAVGILSPAGAGATSLMAQISRAAGKVGKTLVFSPMPLMASELLRFNGMGVTVYDVLDAEELKEIVRREKPVAVLIDGLYGFPSPEGWKGTRGDYLDLLNREIVQLAFHQRFVLFMSKKVNRDPLADNAEGATPIDDGCTDVLVLTFDAEAKEHRLRTVKSRAGTSNQSQRLIFDRSAQSFSAVV